MISNEDSKHIQELLQYLHIPLTAIVIIHKYKNME